MKTANPNPIRRSPADAAFMASSEKVLAQIKTVNAIVASYHATAAVIKHYIDHSQWRELANIPMDDHADLASATKEHIADSVTQADLSDQVLADCDYEVLSDALSPHRTVEDAEPELDAPEHRQWIAESEAEDYERFDGMA